MTCTAGTVTEPAHDAGGGRPVATGTDPDGNLPGLPPSFDGDGEALLMATPTDGPTGRNPAATRAVRLGLGHSRDVPMGDADGDREGRPA
jgi:hypothetical protein